MRSYSLSVFAFSLVGIGWLGWRSTKFVIPRVTKTPQASKQATTRYQPPEWETPHHLLHLFSLSLLTHHNLRNRKNQYGGEGNSYPKLYLVGPSQAQPQIQKQTLTGPQNPFAGGKLAEQEQKIVDLGIDPTTMN